MGLFSSIAGSVLGSVASSVVGGLFGGGGGGGGSSSGGSGFSMTDLIGPALQVGGSLLGGKLQNDSNEEINAHNLRLAQDQIEWQRQYAHNRIQWQVEDAQKAGLHPMVGAGLSPVSFSPVSANLTPNSYDWVGDIGQNLGYAAAKAKTNKQQQQAFDFQVKLGNEQLNGVRLDNELKVMQILGMASQLRNSGPAAPDLNGGKNFVGGQNDSGSPDDSFSTGTNPLLSLARVGNTLMAHINPDVSDSITEDIVRNQLANMNAEFQAGRLTPEVARHLSNNEKRMLARGEAELVYTPPSTWRFVLTPKMRPKYSTGGKEVSGKLNFSKLSY